MEGSSKGNSSLAAAAPFLVKTYEMVDNPLTDAVVSWSRPGLSFVVWNPPQFAADLLPKYFKHNNFSSFIRQLNTYGFRKSDPERWEFANEEFVRGKRHLLGNIRRRKPVHSHSGQTNPDPLTEPERREFLRTIKRLKQEKQSLQSELERHKNVNREYERQIRLLAQALDEFEQRSKNPSKRRCRAPAGVDMDLLTFCEGLVCQIPNPGLNEDCYSDYSNEDRVVEPVCESPPISSICIDFEGIDKTSGADTSVDEGSGASQMATGAGPEANDVFWQQFLTDAERNLDSDVDDNDDCRKKVDGFGGDLADYEHKQPWSVNEDYKPNLQMMGQCL